MVLSHPVCLTTTRIRHRYINGHLAKPNVEQLGHSLTRTFFNIFWGGKYWNLVWDWVRIRHTNTRVYCIVCYWATLTKKIASMEYMRRDGPIFLFAYQLMGVTDIVSPLSSSMPFTMGTIVLDSNCSHRNDTSTNNCHIGLLIESWNECMFAWRINCKDIIVSHL